MNVYQFAKSFEINLNNNQLQIRKDQNKVAISFLQKFSINKNNPTYWQHCKYMILRYKPWTNCHAHVLNGLEELEQNWIDSWCDFLENDNENLYIPLHIKIIERIQANVEIDDLIYENSLYIHDDNEDEESDPLERQEAWMGLQTSTSGQTPQMMTNNDVCLDLDYWAQDRLLYSEEQLEDIGNWVLNQKIKFGRHAKANI